MSAPGTYTIAVTGPARATSPPFGIDAPARLNVGAWMSVEPAIDFTAGVPLALARVIAGDR